MPTPTVRVLLARRELGLRLLTEQDALPSAGLDAPVSWVHSSDLADPTPFLTAGQVLLTTGTQFGDDSLYDGYVERLAESGVVALGFGTEVIRSTPPALVDACRRAGIPLLEVPYRTPFIAIAQYVADLAAEQAYARNTWALAAQRAVSLAALRPDGLGATLAELARQLDRWVALVDEAGVVERVFPARALTAPARATVEAEAARMLGARRRAASTVAEGGATLSLQTIGGSDRLLGVLAHGGADEVDQAAQQVVTSVVALAGLALDQGHALESARATMRTSLLRTLEDARTLAAELHASGGVEAPALGPEADDDVLSGLAGTLDRARSAVESSIRRREAQQTAAEHTELSALLVAPDDQDARARASALLAPLAARDPTGTLTESLRVWLEHNGVFDAAARELGVHRHTLTARIRTAGRALGRDFAAFDDRVEAWAALRLAGRSPV